MLSSYHRVASASDRIRVSGEQRAPASAPLLPGALVTESTAVNDGLWMPPGGKARTGRKGVEEGEGGVGAGARQRLGAGAGSLLETKSSRARAVGVNARQLETSEESGRSWPTSADASNAACYASSS